MSKKALITGITGQDSSYLAELLISKGCEVHGIMRRSSSPENHSKRIDHIFNPESKAYLHYGQLGTDMESIIYDIKPDEIFNIGSQSHVGISFEIPIYTANVTGLAVLHLLETVRRGVKEGILKKDIKFYQASSSEMWGLTPPPQNENSPLNPISPYGVSKTFAYFMTRTYRMGYNMFACNGILHNHSSPRRGVNFVARKITRAVARIKSGLQDKIILGNLDSKRDIGHAKDYVNAMYMIMQADKPDDWVVATGETHTIREIVEFCFDYVGLDPWKYVEISNKYFRPVELPALLGDSSKIREKLGWTPEYNFETLFSEMIDNDIKLSKEEIKLKEFQNDKR